MNDGFAQSSPVTYSFVNYGVNQGLPSSEVYDLYQDPKTGLLWIATDRGVVKFDGYSFITYTVDDGLTDNVILNLSPDCFGNLWCYALNALPCYLDPDGKIVPFRYNSQLQKNYADHSNFNVLTASLSFDRNKTLFITPHYYFGKITVDSSGNMNAQDIVRASRENGFINFFPEKSYFYFSETPETNYAYPVRDIIRSAIHKVTDSLFVLTSENEIRIYNGLTLKKTILGSHRTVESGRVNDTTFWVSYESGGVDFFNPSGELLYHFLDNEVTSDVIQDNEGGIWFSTVSNGIFYLKNTRVKTFVCNPNDRLNSISFFREQLYMGYYSGAVYTLNTQNFKCQPYTEFKMRSPAFLQADTLSNQLYIGCREFTRWNGPDSIFKYGTIKISEDNNEGIVFFSNYVGFSYKKGQTITSEMTLKRVNDATILDTTTLLATNDGLYTYINKTMSKISGKELNGRITDIDRFRDGIVCAAMGGGLIFYNRDTLFAIKKTNGLFSNLCTEVFVENDSTVWLATTSGANKIIIDADYHYKISGYTIAEGLLSNEIVDIEMKNELIWIATKKGLNYLNKNDEFIYQMPNLFPAIHKVIANGVEAVCLDNKFQLAHNDNNVEVFFNAISFSRNKLLVYRYRLNGENEWNITANRSVVFQALPTGKHLLEIQASTDNMHWSETVSLEIIITPPYWQAWWFILLLFVSSGGIISVVFIYRFKQQKLKVSVVEMEMKALRAQMNPHFIFNSLNSIQNFVMKNDRDSAQGYLVKFARLVRNIFDYSQADFILLKNEIETLDLYIQLEKLRASHKFQYSIHVDDALSADSLYIPAMLIQPIVENAILHGLLPLEKGNGLLNISFKRKEQLIICVIEDNGIGRIRSKELNRLKQNYHRSAATSITAERLSLLKKTHRLEATCIIEDLFDTGHLPSGTKVTLTFPFKTKPA